MHARLWHSFKLTIWVYHAYPLSRTSIALAYSQVLFLLSTIVSQPFRAKRFRIIRHTVQVMALAAVTVAKVDSQVFLVRATFPSTVILYTKADISP